MRRERGRRTADRKGEERREMRARDAVDELVAGRGQVQRYRLAREKVSRGGLGGREMQGKGGGSGREGRGGGREGGREGGWVNERQRLALGEEAA